MNELAAFLEDIAASPHDDAPRLVLADWIEEQADEGLRPLAEFIRVQYALDGLHPGNPRRPGLLKLQQALLPVQLERWKGSLSQFQQPRPQFRRGFVEQLTVSVFDLPRLDEGRAFGLPLRSLALSHSSCYQSHRCRRSISPRYRCRQTYPARVRRSWRRQ